MGLSWVSTFANKSPVKFYRSVHPTRTASSPNRIRTITPSLLIFPFNIIKGRGGCSGTPSQLV